jgi:hypothetical protein
MVRFTSVTMVIYGLLMVVTLFMISQMSLVPNAALSMGIFTMLAVMKNNVPYVVDNFSAVDAIWMVRNTLKDLMTLVNITQVYTSNLLQVKHRSRISKLKLSEDRLEIPWRIHV